MDWFLHDMDLHHETGIRLLSLFPTKHIISKNWQWCCSKTCNGFFRYFWNLRRNKKYKNYKTLKKIRMIIALHQPGLNHFYLNWPFNHSVLTFYRNEWLVQVMFSQSFHACWKMVKYTLKFVPCLHRKALKYFWSFSTLCMKGLTPVWLMPNIKQSLLRK